MSKKKELVITEKIMERVTLLDCSNPDGMEKLEGALRRLPIIKKDRELSVEYLEKVLKKLEDKFPINLSYIMRSYIETQHMYTGMIKVTQGKENGNWLRTIYAVDFKEILMKAIFFIYYYVKKERRNANRRATY